MEYADGYIPIKDEILDVKTYNDENIRNYARTALLKLALYCSISHNDPNLGNILINLENNHHVLLIDFGSTIALHDKQHITPKEKTEIINLLKTGTSENYKIALQKCNKMYINEGRWSPLQWVHESADTSIIQPLIQQIIDKYPTPTPRPRPTTPTPSKPIGIKEKFISIFRFGGGVRKSKKQKSKKRSTRYRVLRKKSRLRTRKSRR